MSHERSGLVNIEERHIAEATALAGRFPNFTSGCRVLFLIQRTSDGGHTNNSKLRSYITRDTNEWIRSLAKLIQEMEFYPKTPLRIYQTINSRNIEKGIREYKHSMLDADYYDDTLRKWFYLDAKNRIISSIMKRNCKETSYFLYDCDTADLEVIERFKEYLGTMTDVIEFYPSRSGYHIITKPFNHTSVVLPPDITMSTDAMMLLKWSNIGDDYKTKRN